MTLDGIASVGGETGSAVETPTAPATAPAPASPLEPKPETYFDRMQRAVAEFDSKQGTVEDEAKEVAESVTDAPVSGSEDTETKASETPEGEGAPKTDESQATPQEPEQPKQVSIPYDKLPDNMRAELRRANLAPEVKEALAEAWYQTKAYHDVGFTVDQARQLKAVGFTPEVAQERLRLHPTLEDAATDMELAGVARTLIDDYQNNPAAFVDGLAQHAPDAFPALADTIAENLRSIAPTTYKRLVSSAIATALDILESKYSEEDYEAREKVRFVRDQWFPKGQQREPDQPAFNPNDPYHKRVAELEQQQKAAYEQQRTSFVNAAQGYGRQAVLTEISKRVTDALPSGVDPEIVNRASYEVARLVEADFFGNRSVVANIERMINQADLSQEALDYVVNSIYNRAMPLIAVHAKPVIDFWAKNARVKDQPASPAVKSQPMSPASSRTVANAPTAAKVPASSPQPPGDKTPPPKDFIAEGRKKGWDTGKIIGAWLSGQR